MSSITISFDDVTLTSSSCQIVLIEGNFALEPIHPFEIDGSGGFSLINVTSRAIEFGVETGRFNGILTAPVSSSGGPPVIEVAGFSGSVTLSWPTHRGRRTEMLQSGDMMTLNGFPG